jgi:hypothetical protein
LLKTVMEEVTSFEDSLFYDVSSWTMRHAFGVLSGKYDRNPEAILGERIGAVSLDGGELTGGRASVAYAMLWDDYYAPRALYRFLNAGIIPRIAKAPFSAVVDGRVRKFDRGTILLPTRPRADIRAPSYGDVHALVETAVADDHVRLFALSTGQTASGIDFGSPSAAPISLPRVGMLAGTGISAYQAGEIWHLLSERMEIPVSLLDPARLDRVDLSAYDVCIVPTGDLTSIQNSAVSRIGEWVRAGGTLIVLERAVEWAIRSGLLEEHLLENQKKDSTAMISYARKSAHARAERIPGTILRVRLDTTHPVAYGLEREIEVFRRNELVLQPSPTPGANVAWYTKRPLVSGYAKPERVQRLGQTASAVARENGNGHVIALLDSPAFRGFWFGTNGLLLNAVFFGPVL